MKKIRVVMLSSQFMPDVFGGAEQQCLKLSKELTNTGCEITILTSRKKSSTPKKESIEGVTILRLWSWGNPQLLSFASIHSSIIWFFKVIYWFRKNKKNFDVIHIHQAKFNAFAGLFAANLFNKRTIIKIGNSGNGFDLLTLKRKKLIGRFLFNYVIKHLEIVIAISTQIKNELLSEGIPSDKIIFLPNGVEMSITYPLTFNEKSSYRKTLHIPIEKKIFLFVGRLDKQKDLALLIDSFASVNPIKNNFQLVLVGDGDLRKKIENLVCQHKISDAVLLTGYQKNVFPYFLASDFFILSTKTEGLSNALLEAMSVGLIPISTLVSGSDDLITPGESGFLVEVGSKESLARAIKNAGTLASSAMEYYSKNSFQTIKKNYEMRIITKKYRQLYNSVLT